MKSPLDLNVGQGVRHDDWVITIHEKLLPAGQWVYDKSRGSFAEIRVEKNI